jgi:hypothetical protein
MQATTSKGKSFHANLDLKEEWTKIVGTFFFIKVNDDMIGT